MKYDDGADEYAIPGDGKDHSERWARMIYGGRAMVKSDGVAKDNAEPMKVVILRDGLRGLVTQYQGVLKSGHMYKNGHLECLRGVVTDLQKLLTFYNNPNRAETTRGTANDRGMVKLADLM